MATAAVVAIVAAVLATSAAVAVVAAGGVLPVVDTNDLRQRLQEVLDTQPPPSTEEVDRDD